MAAQRKTEKGQFVHELLWTGILRRNRVGRYPVGFVVWEAKSRHNSAGLVSSPAIESKQPALMRRVA